MYTFGIFVAYMITQIIAYDNRKGDPLNSKLKITTTNTDISVFTKKEWEKKFGFGSREKRSGGVECPVSCGSKLLPVCYCDTICHYFNDCCLEADKSTKVNLPSTKQSFSCDLPYPINTSPYSRPFGVVIVRTCLPKFQFSKLAGECVQTNRTFSLLHFLPVTNAHGMTYANVFCALCNDEEHVELWNIETDRDDLMETVSEQNLTRLVKMLTDARELISIPPSTARPRICIRASTKDLDTNQTALCSKYQKPVLYNNEIYRNSHCITKSILQNCFEFPLCHIQCIEEKNVDMGRYIMDKSGRRNLFRAFFALEMIYKSGKCQDNDIFDNAKVKCVRLGCLNAADRGLSKHCKMFEILYSDYKADILWPLNQNVSSKDSVAKRYLTFLYYVFYINKFVAVEQHIPLRSYRDPGCNHQVLDIRLTYKDILSQQESVKLESWFGSLQISYQEIYATGDHSEILERILRSNVKDSKKNIQNRCSSMNSLSWLYLANDKDQLISSLARYHTPFLFKYNCIHIHLTISITEKTDGSGEIHREYKPTEFYCVNGHSSISQNNLLRLMFFLYAFTVV